MIVAGVTRRWPTTAIESGTGTATAATPPTPPPWAMHRPGARTARLTTIGSVSRGSRLRAGECPERQALLVGSDVHLDLVALCEISDEDLLRQRVLDVLLNGALEGPRAVVLIVAVIDQEIRRRLREAQRQLFLAQALLHVARQ